MPADEPNPPRERRPTTGRRLRIGIDAHAIGERRTGNERFIANLVPAIRDRCRHDLVLYFTNPEAAAAWSSRGLPRTRIRVVRPAHPLLRIPLTLPAAVALDRLDALFVQYSAPPVLSCPVVTVVHDVAFWKHPEWFSTTERIWMRRTIPFTMRRADGIVTVSRFSQHEIAEMLGIPLDRIGVAYDAVDPAFLDPTPRPAPEEPPLFLALGNLQPRKNLITLIRGFRRLVTERPDTPERLVIVGQEWLRAETIRGEAEDLIRSGRVRFTGYLADEQVVGLLQRATAFAFPSVYEGFGLPVVEAMAVGTPVLVADIPVMREIAADAAVRLPPTDPGAWAEALGDLAGDPERRAALAAAGRENIRRFSWTDSADVVLDALERAAVRRRG
jgi:glycosyltransferase involved in cell wall biosynthesis